MDIFNGVELSAEQKAAVQKNLDEGLSAFAPRTEVDAVNAKNQELLAEKAGWAEKRRLAEEESAAAKLDKATKDKDVETLNASWAEKYSALETKLTQKELSEKSNAVSNIAGEFVNLNVVPDPLVRTAMKDAISKRIDIREGKTVVLDAAGNLTSLVLEDLFAEIKSSTVYKPHLVATKASGGGAFGSDDGGGTGGATDLASAKTKAERLAVLEKRLAGKT